MPADEVNLTGCTAHADMLLMKPLDGVFAAPEVLKAQATDMSALRSEPEACVAAAPTTYVFVAAADSGGAGHKFPPAATDDLNSGIFIVRPDKALFECFMMLLAKKNSFDPGFGDQGLLRHFYRRRGGMPWTALSPEWNANWPNKHDLAAGVASYHEKFWQFGEWLPIALIAEWFEAAGRMKGFTQHGFSSETASKE